MTAWRIEVAPFPGLSNVAVPTKAIITIPITLYGYGNGDDAEDGGPERRRDGREHGEHKADKERFWCETRGADLCPNISPCSQSWPGGHGAPAVPYAAAGPTKLWHHASKASLSSSRSPSTLSAPDCTASSGLSLPEATARKVSASPVTTRSGSGTEPCLTSTLSPSLLSLNRTWNASPSIRNS